jgi:hypothetical protein
MGSKTKPAASEGDGFAGSRGECESGGALFYPFVTIGGGALPLPIGALPFPTHLATLKDHRRS